MPLFGILASGEAAAGPPRPPAATVALPSQAAREARPGLCEGFAFARVMRYFTSRASLLWARPSAVVGWPHSKAFATHRYSINGCESGRQGLSNVKVTTGRQEKEEARSTSRVARDTGAFGPFKL